MKNLALKILRRFPEPVKGVLRRAAAFRHRLAMPRAAFCFRGREYGYFHDPGSLSFRDQRIVEIPVFLSLLEGHAGRRILEIGNSMSHYCTVAHDVLDKNETAPGIINAAISEFEPDGTYDLILAVSTLEREDGGRGKGPFQFVDDLSRLLNMLSPGGSLVFDLCGGCNADVSILTRQYVFSFADVTYMKRVSRKNEWAETDLDSFERAKYGEPFPGSNALAFITMRNAGTFSLRGREYSYFYHPYNLTWADERIVEIPVAREFLSGRPAGAVLEVGNVLSHYFDVRHDIVDKYENADGVINEDATVFNPGRKYDLIVSVSTLEHVGMSGTSGTAGTAGKVRGAIDNLRSLLAPGGEMMFTAPLGCNEELDDIALNGRIPDCDLAFLERMPGTNEWYEAPRDSLGAPGYDRGLRCANVVVIGRLR